MRPNNIIPGRRNEDKHSVGESAQENEKISKYQQKTSKRLAKRDSKVWVNLYKILLLINVLIRE